MLCKTTFLTLLTLTTLPLLTLSAPIASSETNPPIHKFSKGFRITKERGISNTNSNTKSRSTTVKDYPDIPFLHNGYSHSNSMSNLLDVAIKLEGEGAGSSSGTGITESKIELLKELGMNELVWKKKDLDTRSSFSPLGLGLDMDLEKKTTLHLPLNTNIGLGLEELTSPNTLLKDVSSSSSTSGLASGLALPHPIPLTTIREFNDNNINDNSAIPDEYLGLGYGIYGRSLLEPTTLPPISTSLSALPLSFKLPQLDGQVKRDENVHHRDLGGLVAPVDVDVVGLIGGHRVLGGSTPMLGMKRDGVVGTGTSGSGGSANGGSVAKTGNSLVGLNSLNFFSGNGGDGGSANSGDATGGAGGCGSNGGSGGSASSGAGGSANGGSVTQSSGKLLDVDALNFWSNNAGKAGTANSGKSTAGSAGCPSSTKRDVFTSPHVSTFDVISDGQIGGAQGSHSKRDEFLFEGQQETLDQYPRAPTVPWLPRKPTLGKKFISRIY